MGQQVEGIIKVEVISEEMVTPSLPPSSLPQTFTQSRLDQLYPPNLMPLLLFYQPPKSGHQFDVVARLKSSLTQALNSSYPFAGRFIDDTTISCAYQGVPFYQTKVHSTLSDVLGSSHTLNSLFPDLLPPRQTSSTGPLHISNLIPLSIKVNVFLCGGVVIGWYNLHKLFDGAGLGTFFKYWSALALNTTDQHELDLIKPDFQTTIDRFPPHSGGAEQDRVVAPDLLRDVPRSNTVVKSFKFDMDAITRLKAMAATKAVPTPSRFEVLAAFIWEHVMKAAPTSQHNDRFLSFSINMRPRMIPPVPKQAMGNIISNVRVNDNTAEEHGTLQQLLESIDKALSEMDLKIKTVYKGEEGAAVLCKERKAHLERLMDPNTHTAYPYQLNSICYNGLSDADFGFGIPCWVVPIDSIVFPPVGRDFIMLTDYKHPTNVSESGIEAWFNLDKNHMKALESSSDFLAFATPNYSSS